MKVKISLEKSLHESASDYFTSAKNSKSKISKIQDLIKGAERDFEREKKKAVVKVATSLIEKRKLEWFEKFHWFFTSNGFLVIAGRDKKSNEVIVKKHLEKDDLYFHAEITGAAHCILKNGVNAKKEDWKEAASFAAVFSKAWTHDLKAIDVYYVNYDQVSKQAPSKQFLSTGEFMIYGKRNYFKDLGLNFAIGFEKFNNSVRIVSGPISAVKKNSVQFTELFQGNKPKSVVAKKLKAFFEGKSNERIDLDELIRMVPDKLDLRD